MNINATESGILAGYLSLLGKSSYNAVYRIEHCVEEQAVDTTKNIGCIVAQSGVDLLKDKINAMKKHIEMAEQFLEDLEAE